LVNDRTVLSDLKFSLLSLGITIVILLYTTIYLSGQGFWLLLPFLKYPKIPDFNYQETLVRLPWSRWSYSAGFTRRYEYKRASHS
jgi:hypothetical protein